MRIREAKKLLPGDEVFVKPLLRSEKGFFAKVLSVYRLPGAPKTLFFDVLAPGKPKHNLTEIPHWQIK